MKNKKVIDINEKLKYNNCRSLVELANEIDATINQAILNEEELKDIAGIVANRLGEIIRIFDGDKDKLKYMCFNIVDDRINLGG